MVDTAVVDSTLGVSVADVTPSPQRVGSCSYTWDEGDEYVGLLGVAVPGRAELNGKTGRAAFTAMVDAAIGSRGLAATPLKGVGAKARFATIPDEGAGAGGGAVVLAKDGRVVIVTGIRLTPETARTIAKVALARLP